MNSIDRFEYRIVRDKYIHSFIVVIINLIYIEDNRRILCEKIISVNFLKTKNFYYDLINFNHFQLIIVFSIFFNWPKEDRDVDK